MATDPRTLLASLEDYLGALERHFEQLRARHDTLRASWAGAAETYAGTGAEVFAAAFGQATARFEDYIERGGEIRRMLNAQIERLRRFDSPASSVM
jgi:uncharacterized protein YukE